MSTKRIGQYNVPDEVLEPYVKHVLERWVGKIGPLQGQKHSSYEFEKEREQLHNAILEAIGLSRVQYSKYPEFEQALEKYIDNQIPKEPIVVHTLITPSMNPTDIIKENQ
jgi:hypothetical protein